MAVADPIGAAVAAITAIGTLGTAAFGLVDAFKSFGGGVSNVGFASVETALKPFATALDAASTTWKDTLKANWINGMDKEAQKTAAKTLVRLGLDPTTAAPIAGVTGVTAAALTAAMTNAASAATAGAAVTAADAQVFGRVNAVIDAAMDSGYERGDQQYRNASKVWAGVASVVLSLAAATLLFVGKATVPLPFGSIPQGDPILFAWALLVGLIAVPVAPIAKDISSSLQAAAAAIGSKT